MERFKQLYAPELRLRKEVLSIFLLDQKSNVKKSLPVRHEVEGEIKRGEL